MRPPARGARAPALTVLRVTSGNFLEMFDFFLFGFYAKPIGDAFFPAGDPAVRLILAFLGFAAAFLMRPLGAIVLGAYVDRVGRRKGLIVTLAIMAAGTLEIAATPAHATFAALAPGLGILAPLLVLAAPVGFALNVALAPEQIAAWGWRLPFALGCAIVPFVLVIRRSLAETEAFLARPAPPDLTTALRTLAASWRVVLQGMMLVVLTTVSFHLAPVYTPTFGRQVLGLDTSDTLRVTLAVGVANLCVLPAMGALSDRLGRRPLLVAASVAMLVSAYPALAWLAAAPTFAKMLFVELWLAFLYASYNGAMVAALTEMVPGEVRTGGFSLAYSLATALFGGLTPAASQALIKLTADKAAPGLWVTAAAAISLLAALRMRDAAPAFGSQSPSR